MTVLVECRNPQRCRVQNHQQGSPADLACGTASSRVDTSSLATSTRSASMATADAGTESFAGVFIDAQPLGRSAVHFGRHAHNITLESESGTSIEAQVTSTHATLSAQQALLALHSDDTLYRELDEDEWQYVVDPDIDPELIAADRQRAGRSGALLDELLGDRREQVIAEALASVKEDAKPKPTAQQILSDTLRAAHPDVEIFLGSSGPYTVLSNIKVPEHLRGQGKAHAVMADLIASADEQGTPLALTPSDAFGSSKKRLEAFYGGYGFVANKGRNKDFQTSETMVRPAQPGQRA